MKVIILSIFMSCVCLHVKAESEYIKYSKDKESSLQKKYSAMPPASKVEFLLGRGQYKVTDTIDSVLQSAGLSQWQIDNIKTKIDNRISPAQVSVEVNIHIGIANKSKPYKKIIEEYQKNIKNNDKGEQGKLYPYSYFELLNIYKIMLDNVSEDKNNIDREFAGIKTSYAINKLNSLAQTSKEDNENLKPITDELKDFALAVSPNIVDDSLGKYLYYTRENSSLPDALGDKLFLDIYGRKFMNSVVEKSIKIERLELSMKNEYVPDIRRRAVAETRDLKKEIELICTKFNEATAQRKKQAEDDIKHQELTQRTKKEAYYKNEATQATKKIDGYIKLIMKTIRQNKLKEAVELQKILDRLLILTIQSKKLKPIDFVQQFNQETKNIESEIKIALKKDIDSSLSNPQKI